MQIINDNLKCKDDDIRYRATRLKEKFDNYVFLYEKETNAIIDNNGTLGDEYLVVNPGVLNILAV